MFDLTHQYETRIFVNGSPITEYLHTDGNSYVEGRAGSKYEIEFKNNSNERILIVPSVDGLSVLDGNTAGLESSGYVLNARGEIKIPGWRLDKDNVAEFIFGDVRDSYNSRSGNNTSNIGVIGFLVFRELYVQSYQPFQYYPYTWWQGTTYTPTNIGLPLGPIGSGADNSGITLQNMVNVSSTLGSNTDVLPASTPTQANNASSATCDIGAISQNSAPKQEVGTGFGSEASFKTYDTTFTKRDAKYPDAILAIYYDSIRGLERKGIVVNRNNITTPNPFPTYSAKQDGCEPPSDWRGRRHRHHHGGRHR